MKPTAVQITRHGVLACPYCGYLANTQASTCGAVQMAPGKTLICGQCVRPSRMKQDGLVLGLESMAESDLPAGQQETLQKIRARIASQDPKNFDDRQAALMDAIAFVRPSYFPLRPGGMPCYWRDETTGEMAAVVEKFVNQKPMDPGECECLRQYFEQWIMAPAWRTPDNDRELSALRRAILTANTQARLSLWAGAALINGIDPL